MSEDFDDIVGGEELSLLETLDHVLDKGLVATGDITISVADIDLIYLGLNAILGSVETVSDALEKREGRSLEATGTRAPDARAEGVRASKIARAEEVDTKRGGNVLLTEKSSIPPASFESANESARAEALAAEKSERLEGRLPERVNIDSRSVEQGLARLVLAVIELIRRLLEKQAVRRMEGGRLSPEQVEELGLALLKLEEKMRELKGQFGLEDDDLNINLGPVGRSI